MRYIVPGVYVSAMIVLVGNAVIKQESDNWFRNSLISTMILIITLWIYGKTVKRNNKKTKQ